MPPANARSAEPLDVVLHIGSGKTGTSSIQHLLKQNRQRLAELGVLYPRTPGRTRHARLGLFIRSGADLDRQVSWHNQNYSSPEEFRTDFERELLTEIDRSGLSRVLFSDEALYGAPNEALGRLRAFTDRISGSLRVVVYLRRQDDHLCSRYQQLVKIGEVRRFRERFEQTDYSKTYDYLARLRTWQRLVEPTELVVRPFDRDSFVDGSLHQDFLTAVGLDVRAPDLEQVGSHNESLDAESVEFLRILNLHLVEHEGAQMGVINNRQLVARLADCSTGPTLTLPDEVLDPFMEQWEEHNRAVSREYVGDESGRLFRTPRKTRNTTTEQHLAPDRLDHFLVVGDLPARMHDPLRRLVEQEASNR